MALGLSVVASVTGGFLTPPLVRAVAPSWDNIERLAALIAAEVYLAIIVSHVVVFGGLAGIRERLRLRPISRREVLIGVSAGIGAWIGALVVYLPLEPVTGWLVELRETLLWIGSDGGRLEHADVLLFLIAVGRACVLAPLGEVARGDPLPA